MSSPSLGSDLRDASEETNNAQLREAALMWERAAAERERWIFLGGGNYFLNDA